MKKSFFSKEVKIGLAFICALAFLIWGINFLKGVNLFTPSNHYYLKYERIDGLVVSNGVFIKGYKVGQVRDIKYDFTQKESFVVDILMNQDIKLPKGTIAYLFDESIERDGVSPVRLFGVYDEEELKSLLLGLSARYPEFINATYTNDLKTITLREKSAVEVLGLFEEDL